MRTRIVLIGALSAALAVACGGSSDDEDAAEDSTSNLTSAGRTIDPNHLMEDEDIVGVSKMTTEQLQAYFDEKGSFLATFNEDGRSAAQIIIEECKKNKVSPVYMLARIQSESSLVESKKANTKNIPKATGCGCPDGKGCADKYKGFGNQITCAATLVKKYFADLDSKGATIADWSVDKSKKTLDPCTVKPANKATAALYTYTPWVGSYGKGCGATKYLGSSGVAFLAQKYKTALPAGTTTADDGEVLVAENNAGQPPPKKSPVASTESSSNDPGFEE